MLSFPHYSVNVKHSTSVSKMAIVTISHVQGEYILMNFDMLQHASVMLKGKFGRVMININTLSKFSHLTLYAVVALSEMLLWLCNYIELDR